jgi:hypothetical protein
LSIAAFSTADSFRAEAAIKKGKLSNEPTRNDFRPEPLSKTGSIAVLVKGNWDHHNASVAALVSQRLVAKGYKVVDEKKLAAIRQSKVALAALNGDVDAIIRLSSQYGVGTTITLNAQAGAPVRNEFNLMTGTASVAVMAITSGGNIVYSDTVQGKQVGYTPDEAAQKAIEAAALQAVDRMTQG